MICVFLAFVLLPERPVKEFGLSLASAVFLDAFVDPQPAAASRAGAPRTLDLGVSPELGAQASAARR
jgi:hypothetical protein